MFPAWVSYGSHCVAELAVGGAYCAPVNCGTRRSPGGVAILGIQSCSSQSCTSYMFAFPNMVLHKGVILKRHHVWLFAPKYTERGQRPSLSYPLTLTLSVIYLKSAFICLFICSVLVLFLQHSGGSCLV